MSPSPNTPGIPLENSFKPVTRESTKPAYMIKPEPTALPAELVSGIQIDTSLDRDAFLITSRPIPEAVPALLGLQRNWAEWRIQRTEAKVKQLTEDVKVLRFVGESVIRREGFRKPDEELRPKTFRQHRTAKRLNKINNGRLQRQRYASDISSPYYRKEPEEETEQRKQPAEPVFVLDFKQNPEKQNPEKRNPEKRLLHERRNDSKNSKSYKQLKEQMDRREKRFTKIIIQPGLSAQRLIEQRDNLVLKSEAIENARIIRDQKRQERREAIRQSINGAGRKLATGSRQVLVATRNKTKSSYYAAKKAVDEVKQRVQEKREKRKNK